MRSHPAWTREDTNYRVVRSGTPVNEDGFKLGSPTGEIVCEECGRMAMDIENINHGRVNGEPCPNDKDAV